MTKNNLKRYIRWYEKEGDDFIGKCMLSDLDISNLRNLFEVSKNDHLMYYCYPIETKEQLEFFQKRTDAEINLEIYDYFLEIESNH